MAPRAATETTLIQPNAEHHYDVTRADLPLSCPMPGMYLWNSHPKVYLAIEETAGRSVPTAVPLTPYAAPVR